MKIILISHFQNKTGSSGNTSMFQITVRVTTMVTYKPERFSRAPTSCGLCSFPQQNGAERDSVLSFHLSERGAEARLQPARTILSTWQPLGLERSRYFTCLLSLREFR